MGLAIFPFSHIDLMRACRDGGLAAVWRRRATRRSLWDLEQRLLDDIGVTEAERQAECCEWFWES